MPWAVRIVIALIATCSLLIGLLWIFQRRLIFLPDTSVPSVATALPGALDITLHTDDGVDLMAWYLPAPLTPCRATILVAGGNAGNRALRAPLAAALRTAGFGVLLLDYRGYGGNPGSPSEPGLAADARAAYRFLTAEETIPAGELLYFGESLGAAVVAELAAEHPPAAIVLRSPFVDLAAAAQEHAPFLPVRLLLRDRFPVADTVAVLRTPTLVVYGTADTVVPPDQSRAVADRAGGPTEIVAVPGADHNDRILLDGLEMIAAVVSLAERTTCPPAS